MLSMLKSVGCGRREGGISGLDRGALH